MRAPIAPLNPPPRILMGPGPVGVEPRVLQAMALPMLGQFDPAFRAYMHDVTLLLRDLFQTRNEWAFLVNGTARAGIESLLVSILRPGDRVLVPVMGRFGWLLAEIAERCGAAVKVIERPWGSVFAPEEIEEAIRRERPRLVALIHGDTSTTMAQPLADIGPLCRRYGALSFVDVTATLGGMDVPVDAWQIDAVAAGLQKCLSGPPGIAPLTFNDAIVKTVAPRRHTEKGIRRDGEKLGVEPIIASNYFDLAMLMDYWKDALPHHTEAASLLYAAHECIRIVLEEGLEARFARHRLASDALCAGIEALGLTVFGDRPHKMPNVTGVVIPAGIDGEQVRRHLLDHFGVEIGTTFGQLKGKIWRIGTMGYVCRKENVLICLAALESALRQQKFKSLTGSGVDAALAAYQAAANPRTP
ncbi:MAG: alanine--glyoxylate aminotransferase family protein [Gammaproteobacteria bacterium]